MARVYRKIYSAISTEIVPEDVLDYSLKLSTRLKELGFLYRVSGLTKLDRKFNQVQNQTSKQSIYESYFTCGDYRYRNLNKWALNRHVPTYRKIIDLDTAVKFERAASQVRFLVDDKSIYSDFLITWTMCGSESRADIHRNKSWKYGVPISTIALAEYSGVKVFNLKNPDALHRLYAFIQENYDFS